MRYATAYDVGDRKREDNGINEDSIEVAVFEDGHREGHTLPITESAVDGEEGIESRGIENKFKTYGPGDEPAPGASADEPTGETRVYTPETTDESSSPQNRQSGVFVLADGAGGEESGDIASYIATVTIAQELSETVHKALLGRTSGFDLDLGDTALQSTVEEPYSDETFEGAIETAVAQANRAIVEYADESGTNGLYTTVVVGVYIGNRLHYGWVGDSRIYVANQSHREIAALTKDHAKITRLKNEGRIGEVEAYVHPDGNEIDRALGGGAGEDPEQAEERAEGMVETGTAKLYDDDTVLLTSDGLIDAQSDYRELYDEYVTSDHAEEVAEKIRDKVVTDELIRNIILEETSLQATADRFVRLSNAKGGKDNISVILFDDNGLPETPRADEGGLPPRSIDAEGDIEEQETIIREQE